MLRQVLLPTYSVRSVASAVASFSQAYVMIWYFRIVGHTGTEALHIYGFCRNQVVGRYLLTLRLWKRLVLPCILSACYASGSEARVAQFVYQCLRLYNLVFGTSLYQDVTTWMGLPISSPGYRACNEWLWAQDQKAANNHRRNRMAQTNRV